MSAQQQQSPTIELWKNPGLARIGIKRYPPFGGTGHNDEIIQGGQVFRITPEERALNEQLAKTDNGCPFKNQTFTFQGYAEGYGPPSATQMTPPPPPSAPAGAPPAPAAAPDAAPAAQAAGQPQPGQAVPTPPEDPQASAPTPPALTPEQEEDILHGDHRRAYPMIAKVDSVPALLRLHAQASAEDNIKRADRIRSRILELDPDAQLADEQGNTSDASMPSPVEVDQDSGRPIEPTADTVAPSTEEPGGKVVYDPEQEAPLVLQDGKMVDGTVHMLPGSAPPEAAPPPSMDVPGVPPGTVI